jgi:hypothetical protein
MNARQSPPRYRTVSGSSLIEAMAKSLQAIKDEDGLTDDELGRMVGKSGKDQGKAYRTGFTEMPTTSFLRACERWNGRFATDVFALIGMKLVPLDAGNMNDRASLSALTRLLLELSVALEDGEITQDELTAMKSAIEEAGKVVDRLRSPSLKVVGE